MASSPELLGTVQKFAEAGEVKVPMFLVQGIEGYSGNQFLHLTAPELDLLKRITDIASVPLDVQEATPEILSQLNPMQLSSTDNSNVKRLFADIGIELPQAQAPIEAEGPGIIDRFKSMFTMEESPFLFSDTTGVSRDGRSNAEILAEAQAFMPSQSEISPVTRLPMNTAEDSGFEGQVFSGAMGGANMMPPSNVVEPPSALDKLRAAQAKVATTEGFTTPVTPSSGLELLAEERMTPEMAEQLAVLKQARDAGQVGGYFKSKAADAVDLLNMGAGSAVFGAGQVAAGLSDVAGYLGGGGDFSKGAFNLSNTIENLVEDYTIEDGRIMPRLYNPDPDGAFARARTLQVPGQLNELDSEKLAAQRAQIESDSLRAFADASLRGDKSLFAEGAPTELTPAGRAQRAADSVTRMSEQGMPKGLSAEAINRIQEQQAQEAAEKEMDAAGRRLIATQPREVGPVEIQPKVDDRNLLEKGIDRFKANMAARSDAESLEDLDTTAVEGGSANLTSEKINEINAKILAEKDNTIIGEEVKPGDVEEAMRIAELDAKKTPPSNKSGTSTLGDGPATSSGAGDGKGTTSSLYADYKKEILAALGGEKKNKNKEKWEDFSLAMFRIAAGKDPSAVANIAAGLGEAAADKKTSRSIQQERDDKINLLAMKMAGDERIAGIRASGTSSFSTPDRLWKSTYDKILESQAYNMESGTISKDEAIRQASEAASKAFPNSQFALNTPFTGDSSDEEMITVTQNGQTFKVPKSQVAS